jgi:ankyrin repeat protein
MTAVQRENAAAVKRLLDRGADANAANGAGATPLMWAIPDFDKVKLLVSRGVNVNARSTNLGRTPFLIAASYPGTVALLRYLVSKGADPKAVDRQERDALVLAAHGADVDVLRYLVALGLKADERILNAAAGRQYKPAVEYLMKLGVPPPKNFSGMAHWAPPEWLRTMIDKGGDINARTSTFGRTAVIYAASSEWDTIESLKLLLDKGADPNLADNDGETALDWAMHRKDEARIRLLKSYGAKEATTPRDKAFGNPEGIGDARTSVARAVALLQPTAGPPFRKRGCITCHNQSMVAQAAAAARAKNIPIDETLAAQNRKQIEAVYKPLSEEAMQGQPPPGTDLTTGYIAMALAAENHPLDTITAALAHNAASRQLPDGSWPEGVMRPPMEFSTISQTAMGVRVLTLYPIEARKADFAMRLRRARQWLLASHPTSAEEFAMRIMALKWAGASHGELAPAIREWVSQQRPDGGWAQLPQLESDAYGTGVTLYALSQAGFAVTDPVYKRGIEWLLANQYADGSWFVRTRSFPVQPQLESGYPFGYNQWISAAAACWSSLAIAATL